MGLYEPKSAEYSKFKAKSMFNIPFEYELVAIPKHVLYNYPNVNTINNDTPDNSMGINNSNSLSNK